MSRPTAFSTPPSERGAPATFGRDGRRRGAPARRLGQCGAPPAAYRRAVISKGRSAANAFWLRGRGTKRPACKRNARRNNGLFHSAAAVRRMHFGCEAWDEAACLARGMRVGTTAFSQRGRSAANVLWLRERGTKRPAWQEDARRDNGLFHSASAVRRMHFGCEGVDAPHGGSVSVRYFFLLQRRGAHGAGMDWGARQGMDGLKDRRRPVSAAPRVAHDAGVAALRVGFCRAHVRQRHGRSRGRGFVGRFFARFMAVPPLSDSLSSFPALFAHMRRNRRNLRGWQSNQSDGALRARKEALPGFGAWPALPHEKCAPRTRERRLRRGGNAAARSPPARDSSFARGNVAPPCALFRAGHARRSFLDAMSVRRRGTGLLNAAFFRLLCRTMCSPFERRRRARAAF